jgi:hypothetical protein
LLRFCTFLYSSAFVAIAHRKMHVVSLRLRLPRSHGLYVRHFAHAHAYTMDTMVTGCA